MLMQVNHNFTSPRDMGSTPSEQTQSETAPLEQDVQSVETRFTGFQDLPNEIRLRIVDILIAWYDSERAELKQDRNTILSLIRTSKQMHADFCPR